MKKIKLPNNCFTLVDDEDFTFLNARTWYISKKGYVSTKEYKTNKHFKMHRLIMHTPIGMDTDHINGNKLDNRKENLRICTRSENNINRLKANKNNTSGEKGVSWNKQMKKWRSFITIDYKRIELGLFNNKADAIEARKGAEINIGGEYSKQKNNKIKLLFFISYRAHLARQKLLLDELKKDFAVYIREFNPPGDTMAEKSFATMRYAHRSIQGIKPDFLLIRGDRFEQGIIAFLGSVHNIKILHLESGDLSGSIDNRIRFMITALSTYHFATNEESAARTISSGQSPNTVFNFGSLDVEFAKRVIKKRIINENYIVCLYHPLLDEDVKQVIEAVNYFSDHYKIIGIKSNIDYGKQIYTEEYTPEDFVNLLYYASCVVGNSSSGIKECSILATPVVNIGSRQKNRLRSKNVLDVECDSQKIIKAIQFQLGMQYEPDPLYYQPETSKRIAKKLKEIL